MDFKRTYSALVVTLVTILWDGVGHSVRANVDVESCHMIDHSGHHSREYIVDETLVTNGVGVKVEDEYVICSIRTLQSEMDFENLTASLPIPSKKVNVLRIQCNDLLFFESVFSAGQLSSFSEMSDLTIDNCKVKVVPPDAFLGLDHLKRLKINTGNSDWAARSLEVSIGAFETVPFLTSLDLGSNHMWSLPEKLLCQVQSLVTLNLTRNLLSDIDDLGLPARRSVQKSSILLSDQTPPCLAELRSFDVSYNTLRRLGSWRFERMKRLEDLRLDHNWLEELDDDALYGLGTLKSLNLSSNRLVVLPAMLFQHSKSIRSIDLKNNSISALAPGLFSGLEWLVVLDLSRNSLSSQWITVDAFRGLVRLVILNLSHNQLTHLTPASFSDLYTLQVIDLSYNLISSVADSTFTPMSNLHSLNLSKNKLISISSKMFNGLYVLHKLSLDFNQISNIDEDAMRNCTSLSDLGLSGNLLTTVPIALRGLKSLKTLDLGENHLEKLNPESFSGMGQLYGVRLVANQLVEIPKGVCDPLSDLRVFNVAQNKIGAVASGAFVSCPELRVLRLDSNSLEVFPVNLVPQLRKLLWLNVSQNRIAKIDYSEVPVGLEWLDVSHNHVETLGGAWTAAGAATVGKTSFSSVLAHGHHRNAKLLVIDASHNRLAQLDLNSVPPSVHRLILSYNRISKILPDTFSLSGHLQRVDLIGNQLETLPLSALRLPLIPATKSLPEFFLGGNPFLCDCDMEYLLRIQQLSTTRQYPLVLDLDAIICRLSYSRSVTHIPLPEIKPQNFLCPYTFHCFQTCECCEFDACDCSMTCPSNCTCYHGESWTANVVDCANTNLTSIPARIPMDATVVYLDGNWMPVVKSHSFIGRKSLRSLFLNSSQIEIVSNKSFNGLQSLEYLHLESNRLRRLHGYEFDQLHKLKELYLNDNLLEAISNTSFLSLKELEILRLDGNRLTAFTVWQLSLNPYLVEIFLSRNSWQCDCAYRHQMGAWVSDNSLKVVDLGQTRCVWNTTHALGPFLSDYNATCSVSWGMTHAYKDHMANWVPLTVALATGFILFATVAVLLRRRHRLRIWLHTKFGLRLCSAPQEKFDNEKSFDAYFLYSSKDGEFVLSKMVDELEASESYRLCLHYRDLLSESGESVKETMISAMENSRSLVIILSRNFLQGEWTSAEYRAGVHGMVKSCGNKSVTVVLIEPVSDPGLLDLRSVTPMMIRWADKKFWPKFKFSLPDPYPSNVTTQTTTSAASSESTKCWDYSDPNFDPAPPGYGKHGDNTVASFLFQPDAKSPVPFGNFGQKRSSSETPGGESYLTWEGEHVYSTLDPPSPQIPNGPTAKAHPWSTNPPEIRVLPRASSFTGAGLRRQSNKESRVPPVYSRGGTGGATGQTYLV